MRSEAELSRRIRKLMKAVKEEGQSTVEIALTFHEQLAELHHLIGQAVNAAKIETLGWALGLSGQAPKQPLSEQEGGSRKKRKDYVH